MDHGGQNPRKTFVSTFRLDLKPSTPKFVSRGVEYVLNHTRGVRGQGNSRLRNSSTEHQQTPVHPPKVPHFKESQKNCTAEAGSDITPKDTIAGSQALSVSLQQNSGRENAISAEAESSSESSLALLGNGIASKHSSKDVGIKTCEDEDAGDTRSAALCTTEDKTKATSGQPSEKNLDTSVRPPSTHGDINPPRKEKIKGPSVEFQDHQEKVEVQIGGKARLHCAFSSVCFPVASCWIHNREKVLVNSPRTYVESSKTESCVEISQACPGDTGCYTLVVRNRRGCGHHTVVLSVIDRPDPPASSPIVSQLSSKSLVLSWTGPSYDGGSAVTGYIVEVRQEVPDKPGDWIELTTQCKNTSYRVRSGLEPLKQYCFRVRASNSVGVSEPSNVSDCIKMDSKGQDEGEATSYVTVTINNTHKVQDHYNVNEKLGVGKFGQVFRLTHKETGQVCAGKFYKGRGSKDKGAARREIELMNCLHHPKLVQCLGAYDTRSEMVMVMEYIGGGELFKRIVDDNFEHNEPTCARYVQQILEGIQYVHKQKIIHLDLKPENIVCVDTTGTRIKIIDFGLARKLEPGVPLMVMHGTPEFVAPEVISYEPVGLKTDMWSIGVICYVLLSGESPFQGNSDAETLARVTAADYEFDEESFEDISDQAEDFINSLLKKDMRSRLSCDEALAHPWMVSFTSLIRRPTKSLRKDKMRRFLARRKWKKTGKAVLALKRMANLSNKPVCLGSSEEEPSWGPDAESAIQSLEQKLRSEPQFQQVLKDTTLPRGATARLACHVQGYPEPKVEWLQEEDLVEVSSRVSMEYDEDGLCALVLTDLVPADAGLYKCRATNDLGKALCTAKLTVKL